MTCVLQLSHACAAHRGHGRRCGIMPCRTFVRRYLDMQCMVKIYHAIRYFWNIRLTMDPGTLCQLMHLPPEASPDLILLRTTLAAQQWAKNRKLDLSIKPLTLASLNLSEGCKYPELDSQIKAARTRVLFEFTTILAILFRSTVDFFCSDALMKTCYEIRNYMYTNAHIFPLQC